MMSTLPRAARIYIISVIALAGLLLTVFFPRTIDSPLLFGALLLLSSATSIYKVTLPLAGSGSTLSVSYAVDFAALLLLGPAQTMLIAMASAWTQCTFRSKEPSPPYRTLFSMACLAITVQAAGAVYFGLGGVPGTS